VNYSRIVMGIRQKIFDYSPEQRVKATRVLHKAIAKSLLQNPHNPVVDEFGATAWDHRELRKRGICWGD